MSEHRPAIDDRELAKRLGRALAETEPEEELDAAAELRAVGLDPAEVGERMKRVAILAKRSARAAEIRACIEGWIDDLIDGIGDWLTPVPAAAVLRGGSSGSAHQADPRLEEAVALLGNGVYDQAKKRIDSLIAEHGEQELYLWLLAHAELGRDETERARELLGAITGDLEPRARELLTDLNRMMR